MKLWDIKDGIRSKGAGWPLQPQSTVCCIPWKGLMCILGSLFPALWFDIWLYENAHHMWVRCQVGLVVKLQPLGDRHKVERSSKGHRQSPVWMLIISSFQLVGSVSSSGRGAVCLAVLSWALSFCRYSSLYYSVLLTLYFSLLQRMVVGDIPCLYFLRLSIVSNFLPKRTVGWFWRWIL